LLGCHHDFLFIQTLEILMDKFTDLITNFIELSTEASPWLLLGLLFAGLMKAWVPTKILSKHLGGGHKSIIKAALIGAPLPLCSCGVIPVATELRRSGASKPATAAFLVATPETGVDSISVSYAMLGPIMTIYRPITAIASAIITGLLVSLIKEPNKDDKAGLAQTEKAITSPCCNKKDSQPAVDVTKEISCCSNPSASLNNKPIIAQSKTLLGIKYAATQLIDDIIIWLVIGLLFATLVNTFLPEDFLLSYGSGLGAMLMMILISIPMYICATASTPIAAGFILAGLSPGTALVFMMAGPATNISTLGVIKNEMGAKVLIHYLVGISLCAIAFGSFLDFSLNYYDINITEQMQHSHTILPQWFKLFCALLITFLAIKPLRKVLIK